jgi:hypothetical protein
MAKSASGPATSPAGPQGRCEWCNMPHHRSVSGGPALCPFLTETDPVQRGLFLAELLSELAQCRYEATTTYAAAYLAAEGSAEARTQTAKLEAADEHLAAELAAARVAGYQQIIKGE